MPREVIQLRDDRTPDAVVMVRLGSTTLDDQRLAESCEVAWDRWGLYGFSVFELPPGGYDELCELQPMVRSRRRVLVANASDLLANGFPLLATGSFPHWTVVLSQPTDAQFNRVRALFVERANPGFERGTG